MIKKILFASTAALSLACATVPASAAVINLRYSIEDILAGTGPITVDTGSPTGSWVSGPSGWPNGAISSNISGAEGDKYGQIYINMNLLLGRDAVLNPVKFGEVVGFSYFTQLDENSSALNWSVRIYTQPQLPEDKSWYRYKFEGINPTSATGDWFETDLNTPGTIRLVNQRVGTGNTNVNLTDATLAGLAGDATYADEILHSYSLFVGASGNNLTLNHLLGGLTFHMSNGDTVHVALIPEPSTWMLLGAAGSAMMILRGRRRWQGHTQ